MGPNHVFRYLPIDSRDRPYHNNGRDCVVARRRRVRVRGMGTDMVDTTPTGEWSSSYEPTSVMRARARNAERFHMYMASSLRVDETDPHLHIGMRGTDVGVAYYLLDSGDVLAFPMTAFNDEVRMHAPHLNPINHPFLTNTKD